MSLFDNIYYTAKGVLREMRARDQWVLCASEGNLPNQGGQLKVHYLGRKRFADDFLMFFDRDTVGAAISQNIIHDSGLWGFVKERKRLDCCPEDADVFIVDHLFEKSGPQTMTLAPHINAVMPVSATVPEQLAQIRSKGHRRKLQSALKRGITWRKTHTLQDFNLFYDVMYEPFVHTRFQYGASIVPRADMQRMYTHRGFLLMVEEDGQPISGAMIYTSRKSAKTMYYWKYGLAYAETLSPNVFGERNAMTEATVLKYAVDEGFKEVDWGLTRAVCTDGIFHHKKRMGCDFVKTPGAPDFRVHINPKAEARLLSRFPLVVTVKGHLHVICARETMLTGAKLTELQDDLTSMAFTSCQSIRLLVPKDMRGDEGLHKACAEVTQQTHISVDVRALA